MIRSGSGAYTNTASGSSTNSGSNSNNTVARRI